jgi:hypothetical protein
MRRKGMTSNLQMRVEDDKMKRRLSRLTLDQLWDEALPVHVRRFGCCRLQAVEQDKTRQVRSIAIL